MEFLANENFPKASVELLREAGYEVASIAEDSSGAKDTEVLERARREKRVILTFDRDYGEMIYRLKMPTPLGIIYLRFDPKTPKEAGENILKLLKMEELTLNGKFTVLERSQIRQRPLPEKTKDIENH
jgi:predicted nuclease of predicted toxin-antitoxin system